MPTLQLLYRLVVLSRIYTADQSKSQRRRLISEQIFTVRGSSDTDHNCTQSR